jgi:hypothetical protein
MNRNVRKAVNQSGFTIMQMVVTIAIIAIVSTFGVLGIRNARAEYRLQNSARQLAVYLEKSRADAIRRHAAPGNESWVETFGPGTNTYNVRMDFGSGSMETRTFQLEPGITFTTVAQKTAFNWRGRISSRWVYQVFNGDKSMPVDVSGSGDITVGEQHFPDELIPPVEIASVTGDVIPDAIPTPSEEVPPPPAPNGDPPPQDSPTPTPTPTPANNGNGNGYGSGGSGGNGNGNNPTPTPTPISTPTPTATPTPSVTPTPLPACVTTLSPSTLYLSQSAANSQSGTAVLTVANAFEARTLTATQAGSGNSLVLSLSQARIQGSGSTIITVTTKHGAGNRGVFEVDLGISPLCGTAQKLTVSVSN